MTNKKSNKKSLNISNANENNLLLPFHFAKRHGVVAKSITNDNVIIAHRDKAQLLSLIELQRFFNRSIIFQSISEHEFEQLLAQTYETGTETAMEAIHGIDADLNDIITEMPPPEDLLENANDAPIVRLLNAIFSQAIKQNTSDIHFEIFEQKLSIRFRCDGTLNTILEPPRALAPLVTSRIKVMAKLDIAEKRLPQDGRMSLRLGGRAVDVRVSTIPTHFGERVVLRLLDKNSAPLDLQKLGMTPDILTQMKSLIAKPHGIILVTGPTGSGKTTTLYGALNALNSEQRNILTVEDPIEYYLQGIGQTQTNTKIGMTFARGLRAILRQDPDVVMVGEIRDLETAEMAVQASLTGHLVLSTLHTNSALGAITRLRDMGVEPFLLASTIIGVAAQRLVRLLCPHCKIQKAATKAEKALLGFDADQSLYLCDAQGCEQCLYNGFQGRSGIYELVLIDNTLSDFIHDNCSESELEKYARKFYPSIREDGLKMVLEGKVSLEEVLRVTRGDF